MSKTTFLTCILFCCFVKTTFCQYYLRGEVRDERGKSLPNVTIYLQSKGNLQFYSGDNGSFGIPSSKEIDTITLVYDGYENYRKGIATTKYQTLTIKMLPSTAKLMKRRLASSTKNLDQQNILNSTNSFGESYTTLLENNFIPAKAYPETGFAINIDRASYSNIRRFLTNDMSVPSDAVRIEEMLNYFNLKATKDSLIQKEFICNTKLSTCPWNTNNQLAFINLLAPKINLDTIPASNLVFLIDVSGSMDKPNRLPLLQSAFKLLIANLRPIDTISIVTYGGGVSIALNPTSGQEKSKIIEVIDSLSANGDTPGSNAIRVAYSIAKRAFIKNGNNRVIIATDGDFNVGQSSEKDLEDLISTQSQSGILLTCLGVGMGNYKDSKLETLAKKGNGNFAYLDNIYEAEKVLVTEFTTTLFNVASDAFLNVVFNPEKVNQYRLIGYDNKVEAIADTSSEIEGGEIGSGHNMIAIFEIEPNKEPNANLNKPLATIGLQYTPTNQPSTKKIFTIIEDLLPFNDIDTCYKLATTIAMFGGALKNSPIYKSYSFLDIYNMARPLVHPNNFIQNEFLQLVLRADKIYYNRKKRK